MVKGALQHKLTIKPVDPERAVEMIIDIVKQEVSAKREGRHFEMVFAW